MDVKHPERVYLRGVAALHLASANGAKRLASQRRGREERKSDGALWREPTRQGGQEGPRRSNGWVGEGDSGILDQPAFAARAPPFWPWPRRRQRRPRNYQLQIFAVPGGSSSWALQAFTDAKVKVVRWLEGPRLWRRWLHGSIQLSTMV